MALIPGVVVMIEAHTARKGANGVGIRVADEAGTSRILWPSYLAVHLEPLDPTEPCWRCQDLVGGPGAMAAPSRRSKAATAGH